MRPFDHAVSRFGKDISALRNRKGVSLVQAAQFLDADPALLARIEQGRRNALTDQALKLANLLQLNEREILHANLSERILQARSDTSSSLRIRNIAGQIRRLENGQWRARIRRPLPPLDQFIRYITFHTGGSRELSLERIIPDGTVQLVINLDDTQDGPAAGRSCLNAPAARKAWIASTLDRYLTYPVNRREKSLSVHFVPGGFFRLTGIPASEVGNSLMDAEPVLGRSVLSLRECLMACSDCGPDHMTQITEQFLMDKVADANEEHPAVRYVMDSIIAPLNGLVRETGYSHKHVVRLFRKFVGISPKVYQCTCRFNGALRDILAAKGSIDWLDVVFRNGYYDQPHFIREFSRFSGLSPRSFMDSGGSCTRLLLLSPSG